MPVDVAARLTAALRSPESPARPRHQGAAHARAQRRWARWSGPLAAAAAVLAVVAGLAYFVPRAGVTGNTSARQADAPAAAGGDRGNASSAADTAGAAVPRTASGRNYQPGRFGDLGAAGAAGAPGSVMGPPTGPERTGGPRATGNDVNKAQEQAGPPPELSRLTEPTALAACLNAVQAAHGGVVKLVDYARFADRPALVIVLWNSRSAASANWVVVVGPACGVVPGDADERYSGPFA
jgi:hypothetical protein